MFSGVMHVRLVRREMTFMTDYKRFCKWVFCRHAAAVAYGVDAAECAHGLRSVPDRVPQHPLAARLQVLNASYGYIMEPAASAL